ncbi:MAG TPA: dihydroorotate dehydrogenase electron transfer subunit [Frankiaceae bacterium]
MTAAADTARAVQVRAEVLANRTVGAYQHLTVVATDIARHARPGQFIAARIGDGDGARILRRAFAIYQVSPTGVYGGTVEFIVGAKGEGSRWVAARRPHESIDLVGPLGRPFSLPREPAAAVLVGGGYGSAPLFPLAAELHERGCQVDMVLGAGSEDRLFGALEAKRISTHVAFTTDDGSYGARGRVSDVLPALMDRAGSRAVYACGPMPMLRAVAEIAAARGVPSQVAVEESMACGIGVCMTCVLPIVGDDGVTRMARSCVEGPVFRGGRVRFDALGTVPPDAFGAPGAPQPAPAAEGARA